MIGIAYGNAARAQGAENAYASAHRACEGYRKKIAEFERALIIAQAEGSARKAQVDALIALHNNSPLLASSGVVFVNAGNMKGKPKTKVRMIYEAAFDKAASNDGIANPASERLN